MNNKKTLLFAGTTEGHQIALTYGRMKLPLLVCVATEYGKITLEEDQELQLYPWIEVRAGRLDEKKMEELVWEEKIDEIIDATHPYAEVVSKQILSVCKKYERTYIRIIREQEELEEREEFLIRVQSFQEAEREMRKLNQPILLTTGSKDIKVILGEKSWEQPIYVRVLPSEESIRLCLEAGVKQQHIIGMQGPFSQEMNEALIQQYQIGGMVTKEAGVAGGFGEKYKACKKLRIPLIVVGRPKQEDGISCSEYLDRLFGNLEQGTQEPTIKHLALVGIGSGKKSGITELGRQKLVQAQVIFGASRMLEFCRELNVGAKLVPVYQTDAIKEYLKQYPKVSKAAVALSGDVGFNSGAKKIIEAFDEYEIELIPGISIVEALSARFRKSWDDMKLISCHGNQTEAIPYIVRNLKCLFILGSKEQLIKIARDCISYGLEKVEIYVGVNLDCENEKVLKGTPKDFVDFEDEGLITVIVENKQYSKRLELDISDEEFVRGSAPMTKREIRTLSVSKLNLEPDSTVIDVGTGTGSVGIACAKIAYGGTVYGIEIKEDHLKNLEKNKIIHQVPNFIPIIGDGVDIIPSLPKASHGFIGGSSGKIEQILDLLLENNPKMKIVINGITLETMSQILDYAKKNQYKVECIQVAVTTTREVGSYHMLQGTNPIFIFTLNTEVDK